MPSPEISNRATSAETSRGEGTYLHGSDVVQEWMITTGDKIDALAGAIGGTNDRITSLRDVLEETLRGRAAAGDSPTIAPFPEDELAPVVPSSEPAVVDANKTKKKKRKKKKKKKGGEMGAANRVAGVSVKAFVGLATVALLVSVAVGLGHGGKERPPASLLRRPNDKSNIIEERTKLEDEGETSHRRVSQAKSAPSADAAGADSALLYYLVWHPSGYWNCDNDLSLRPANYVEMGFDLFETKEDCCDRWFTHRGENGENECMANSPSSATPKGPNAQSDMPSSSIPHSSPPANSADAESALLYYPVWQRLNYWNCDNDLSLRPSNYNELGYTLFETREECCDRWDENGESECMGNLPSSEPSKGPNVQSVTPTASIPHSAKTGKVGVKSVLPYYPIWNRSGYWNCDNDLSLRPSNYIELGYTLFETRQECCDHWFTQRDDNGENECMANLPSSEPSKGSNAQSVTPTATIPPSDAGPRSASSPPSLASDSPSTPTLATALGPPTGIVHHQEPHDLGHNMQDGDAATETIVKPTHRPTTHHEDEAQVNFDESDYDGGRNETHEKQDTAWSPVLAPTHAPMPHSFRYLSNSTLICTNGLSGTMNCNNKEDCYLQENPSNTKKYGVMAAICFGCIFVALGTVVSALYAYHNHRNPEFSSRRPSAFEREAEYSRLRIGVDSVYQFFLGTSWLGWAIALITFGLQICMLSIFVIGAEAGDLVYTWNCPRDQIGFDNKDDLTPAGWIVFGILMFAHLAKDLINGSKLVAMSAKERHDCGTQMRHFFGGALLTSVSFFTLYASVVYNMAIATSDTEVIANSVVILFITQLDELLFGILMVINSGWVRGESHSGTSVQDLEDRIAAMREEFLLSENRSTQDWGGGHARSVEEGKSRSHSRERNDSSRDRLRSGKKQRRLRRKKMRRPSISPSEKSDHF